MQKVYRKVPVDEQAREADYWQIQPYQARLAALEQIRQEYHQWKYDCRPRLQRVYSIVKQQSG